MVGQVDVEYEARPVRPAHLPALEPERDYAFTRLRRISWGAVFAGIAVSLMAHLLLNMLGLGIGLGAVDPGSQPLPDLGTLGTAAGLWWALSGIIAALIGGWVAGRASGIPNRGSGTIHGIVAWAATTLIVLFVLGSVLGGAMSGLFNTAARVLPAATSAVSAGAGQAPAPGMQGVLEEARNLIGAAASNPDEVADVMGRALAADATTQEREAAVTLLVEQSGLSRPEAEARIEAWRAAYQDTAGGARNAADAAAEISSTSAVAAFVALLLGAVAGALGGLWGTPREVLVEEAR